MALAKRVSRSIHNELKSDYHNFTKKKNMIDFQKVNLSLISYTEKRNKMFNSAYISFYIFLKH